MRTALLFLALPTSAFAANPSPIPIAEFPYSAVGRLWSTATGEHCTASLVGRDLVLTVGPGCIFDGAGRLKSDLLFLPAVAGSDAEAQYPTNVVQAWYGTTSIRSYDDLARAWALLRLSSPVGARFGFLGVEEVETDPRIHLTTVGYFGATGEAVGLFGCYRRHWDRTVQNLFRTDCFVGPGGQGAPQWKLTGSNEYRIAGLALGPNFSTWGGGLSIDAQAFSHRLIQLRRSNEGKPSTNTFFLCNRTEVPAIDAAFGYSDGRTWKSSGWYTIARGTCRELGLGRAKGNLVHIFAQGGGRAWNGSQRGDAVSFCVDTRRAFELEGTSCNGPDRKLQPFFPLHLTPGELNSFAFTP